MVAKAPQHHQHGDTGNPEVASEKPRSRKRELRRGFVLRFQAKSIIRVEGLKAFETDRVNIDCFWTGCWEGIAGARTLHIAIIPKVTVSLAIASGTEGQSFRTGCRALGYIGHAQHGARGGSGTFLGHFHIVTCRQRVSD